MMISFPWPSIALNPNTRCHWAVKARAVKKYRSDCCILCRAAKLTKVKADEVNLAIVAYPPDNRARDDDNIQAACKPLQDSISEAIGVDDRYFKSTFERGPPIKYGAINIEITWR